MKKLSRNTIALWALLSFAPSAACADDWPQWLGPTREPVWRESGIVNVFPADGPPLRWQAPLGGGYSGPAVSKGRVFVMDRLLGADRQTHDKLNSGEILHKDPPKNPNFLRRRLLGTERVVCLSETDGSVVWKREHDCPYTSVALYAIGPRCTPTVDNDLVFTLGAEGRLLCLNVTDGSTNWERDFKDDYELEIPEWGIAAHPLVDREKLICVVGGEGTTCVAFDKTSGKELWRALSSKSPGYCPPMIHRIDGERQLIIWHGDALEGLDPETGEVFWTVPFQATFGMSIGAPQVVGRSLYIMCYNRQSALIQIGKDRRSAKIAWSGDTKRGIPGVLNTAVIHDGHIYACGNSGRYSCAKLATGDKLWSTFAMSAGERPSSWGNVFTVRHSANDKQDRYFHVNDLGELIIASMTPAGFDEHSRAKLIAPTHDVGGRTLVWSHPAFANRSIYIRNDREIRCYSLEAKSSGP